MCIKYYNMLASLCEKIRSVARPPTPLEGGEGGWAALNMNTYNPLNLSPENFDLFISNPYSSVTTEATAMIRISLDSESSGEQSYALFFSIFELGQNLWRHKSKILSKILKKF